jgi:GDP-L-fucose synthase
MVIYLYQAMATRNRAGFHCLFFFPGQWRRIASPKGIKMTNYWKGRNVIVTGGSGFLGSYLVNLLKAQGCNPFVPRSTDYDLRYPWCIKKMFSDAGPVDTVFHLAGNVGGIGYNRLHPYQLFHDNALMGIHLIEHAIRCQVRKFVQVSTVCAYPKLAITPFREESLWDGYPEETNAPYGLAKKMLLVQLQAARQEYGFNGIYLLPTNLYGIGDNFNPVQSHVIPALIRKCVEAKAAAAASVEVWGTGNASRDFLYVEDAAEAILLAAEKYEWGEPLNLGSGQEVRIEVLLHHIMELAGYKGKVQWDRTKPDGQPRRVLDTRAAKALLGWTAKTPLREGLKRTIEWYEEQVKEEQAEVSTLA